MLKTRGGGVSRRIEGEDREDLGKPRPARVPQGHEPDRPHRWIGRTAPELQDLNGMLSIAVDGASKAGKGAF
jgi:hypothetical protein